MSSLSPPSHSFPSNSRIISCRGSDKVTTSNPYCSINNRYRNLISSSRRGVNDDVRRLSSAIVAGGKDYCIRTYPFRSSSLELDPFPMTEDILRSYTVLLVSIHSASFKPPFSLSPGILRLNNAHSSWMRFIPVCGWADTTVFWDIVVAKDCRWFTLSPLFSAHQILVFGGPIPLTWFLYETNHDTSLNESPTSILCALGA